MSQEEGRMEEQTEDEQVRAEADRIKHEWHKDKADILHAISYVIALFGVAPSGQEAVTVYSGETCTVVVVRAEKYKNGVRSSKEYSLLPGSQSADYKFIVEEIISFASAEGK